MPKSSCAHLERQLDFSLSEVLSVRITHSHEDTRISLPRFGWHWCLQGERKGVRLGRWWKWMCLNSIFVKTPYFIWTTILPKNNLTKFS